MRPPFVAALFRASVMAPRADVNRKLTAKGSIMASALSMQGSAHGGDMADVDVRDRRAPGSTETRWARLYFDDWVASEGLELLKGYKVDDVYTVPLRWW